MKHLQLSLFEAYQAYLAVLGLTSDVREGRLVPRKLPGDFAVKTRRLSRVLQPHAEDFEKERGAILESYKHSVNPEGALVFEHNTGQERLDALAGTFVDLMVRPMMEQDFDRGDIEFAGADLAALERFGLVEPEGQES